MSDLFSTLIKEDEVISSGGSSIKLGLNTVKVVDIKYNKETFQGSEVQQLNVEFLVNGSDKSLMFVSLEPNKFFWGKNEVKSGDQNFDKAKENHYKGAMATIVHFVKAFGVTEEKILEGLKKKAPKNIEQYTKTLLGLLPKNYKEVDLDGFFMYQWKIKGKSDRTWLELGPNMGKGYFLTAHVSPVGGSWIQKVENGTYYWEDAEGNRHPISKSKAIMEGPCGSLQSKEGSKAQSSSSDDIFGIADAETTEENSEEDDLTDW